MLCFCFTGDVKFVYDTDTPDESGNWGPYEMAEQGCSRTCGWVQSKTSKLVPFEFLAFCFKELFGEITPRLPLFSFSKKYATESYIVYVLKMEYGWNLWRKVLLK